ncbi:MAG: histidine kinase dimerization/phospho-acceptor domain-containing protein [Alphaproteobacteria bacterium]
MLHPKKGCNYLSKNFADITGNEAVDFLAEDFYNLLHPDSRERLSAQLLESNAHHFPSTLHLKLKQGDGSYQWYACVVHQPEDGSEDYVCVLENIDTHVQAQSTLQKAKLEAELALSTRSEFLANMSHDLRTPLNAVIGFAQIIEEQMFGNVNPQYLDYARHIQESGHDLLAKIEDLLEIASIDAGRVSLNRTDVSLNDMLRHVIAAHSHHAANNDVLIEYAPPACGNMLLHVDRMKTQHIIGHLLANAIKFSHRGGKVSVEALSTEDKGILLRVVDHGVGMNEQKLHALRETLNAGNCWGVGGTCTIGLGLALTREFVVMHGGEVDIQSAIGDGTVVTLTLPEECVRNQTVMMPEYAQVAG